MYKPGNIFNEIFLHQFFGFHTVVLEALFTLCPKCLRPNVPGRYTLV